MPCSSELLPAAPGRATTFFANTATAGSLVSGLAAGGMSQALGHRAALPAWCAVLVAVLAIVLMRPPRERQRGRSRE